MNKPLWVLTAFLVTVLVMGCQAHQNSSENTPSKQRQTTNNQSLDSSSDQVGKSTQTENPTKQSDQDKFKKRQKKIYINSLPGPIPKTSTYYTMIIDLSKGSASKWNTEKQRMAFLSVMNRIVRLKKGITSKGLIKYKDMPSASLKHPEVFSIGLKPGYGENNLMMLYSNFELKATHQIYFSMGHAMTSMHFITELNGHPLKQGHEFIPVSGYLYKIKTDKWYYMKEKFNNEGSIVFKFKLHEIQKRK